jgi:hypothetical protein
MVVKPPTAPQITPVNRFARGARRSKRAPSQCRSTKTAAINPIASRIWAAVSAAATSPATATPAAMLGIMTFRFHELHSRR